MFYYEYDRSSSLIFSSSSFSEQHTQSKMSLASFGMSMDSPVASVRYSSTTMSYSSTFPFPCVLVELMQSHPMEHSFPLFLQLHYRKAETERELPCLAVNTSVSLSENLHLCVQPPVTVLQLVRNSSKLGFYSELFFCCLCKALLRARRRSPLLLYKMELCFLILHAQLRRWPL